ncbi:HEPN domain-containing protein [Roseiflexus sp.]|uniref:HEPN domain-containing protein n=1 Tax=Roseiflexus sp. TaxID=2562120 RepID=UPI0021DBEBD6|nr:HEPN domain-containing protein [Roseiflexus sp.]GIV99151.1 MAG: nucleotidyltransferase [Roseiflexus sp.]
MKESNPLDWVAKAEGDLDMARRALRGKMRHTDAAVFHAQQCAEKYLKALLIAGTITFPKTHDLTILRHLCISNGIPVNVDEPALDFLSGYAVNARYPGAEPSLEEAREAIAIARSVRAFARRWLGVK